MEESLDNSSFVLINLINSTNSTIDYNSSVFLDNDGEIIGAITIDLPLLVLKIVLCLIGVPINITAILITLCRPCVNDSSRPRNVFLLANFFSNLAIFIPALLEIAYYFYPTNDSICQSFVATAGLAELFILQSTLLSLIDRYLAIQYPLWHWNKFTPQWATFWIILSFILTVLVSKSVYIFGIYELGCHVHFASNNIYGTLLGILFVLCIIGRSIVFIQKRTLLRNATHRNGETIELQDLSGGQHQQTGNENELPSLIGVVIQRASSMDSETLRQIEDGATKTMVSGVTSLFIFTFPRLVFYLVINICKAESLDSCSRDLAPAIPYFKQLDLLYAIYHPVIYLLYWRELTISSTSGQQQRKRNSIYD